MQRNIQEGSSGLGASHSWRIYAWYLSAFFFASRLSAQDVLTYHNDLARTGLDSGETVLNPSNITLRA